MATAKSDKFLLQEDSSHVLDKLFAFTLEYIETVKLPIDRKTGGLIIGKDTYHNADGNRIFYTDDDSHPHFWSSDRYRCDLFLLCDSAMLNVYLIITNKEEERKEVTWSLPRDRKVSYYRFTYDFVTAIQSITEYQQ